MTLSLRRLLNLDRRTNRHWSGLRWRSKVCRPFILGDICIWIPKVKVPSFTINKASPWFGKRGVLWCIPWTWRRDSRSGSHCKGSTKTIEHKPTTQNRGNYKDRLGNQISNSIPPAIQKQLLISTSKKARNFSTQDERKKKKKPAYHTKKLSWVSFIWV